MANEREPSQPRGISLKQVHEMRMDIIITPQHQIRKLTVELEQVKGSER